MADHDCCEGARVTGRASGWRAFDSRGMLWTLFKRDRVMNLLFSGTLVIAASLFAGQVPSSAADDPHVLGDARATVTIIEFGDYQCPSCRLFWKEVEPRLRKEYIDTGKVKLVFTDFPIVQLHPEAVLAAMAVDCAGDQKKYWPFHDKVFREQDYRGEDVIRFRAADLKKWAKDIGLEVVPFNECLDSARHKDEVAKDKAAGDSLGVRGTPTFLINRHVVAGPQPYLVFKRVIDDELKR
jgi:protein-disulfide isomerase